MISTLMFFQTITVAPPERVAASLAAAADDTRVLLQAAAEEILRYLYVLSLADAQTLAILGGMVIGAAALIGLGRSRTSAPLSPARTF